jgi:class 3 adenylate cyclase/ketosteroid isomerase-like protein
MAENRRVCTACGTTNEEDARFCEGCGGSLARVCASCGVEASAAARFCRGCGAPLDSQLTHDVSAAGPVRKTVTVMFADLAGSTGFEERVDAETAREVIGRYHVLLRSTAQRHRAGVMKYIGDGFMAVWGVPEIGADDAAHAVDAAVALQERFVELAAQVADTHGVELALRVAVNTGEVVVGAGDADLVGDALNVGARLEAECPRGRVVVGEETWRSTRGRYGYESLGQVQVKGRSAPVAVYQWLGRQSEAVDATPFVGRADELRRLQGVLDEAVAARVARLVTIIGDPGVGKSRLAAEFIGTQGDARVLPARCAVEGTVALAPIVEVLRACDLETEIPTSAPERDRLLRDLNGLTTGVPGSVEENFWALRRFVEVLASAGPVLLVLDDIQWADTLLLDFIEHLVEWVQDVPVLVLALARPEVREIRPDLVTVSRWVSEAVHLGGLDAGATAELAAKVLGATQLPDELLRRLPSSTGGNPLFVRELIGMLAHDGVLVRQPAGWRLTIDVDAIAIPPTIHALLASRLERLEPADRRILEIASVVGSDFPLGAVRALADSAATGITLSLNRLRRLDLAQPTGAYVGDEPVWRFHHVLIRDVAYRRLLKSDRADLHEQLADWVATSGPSVAFDSDEMIARHLEAAHTYRRELGTLDEHTAALALRSARHYAASARRALDRDELVSAGTQAARGAALATADEGVHAELLLIGCEAFLSAGDVASGAPLVDDLEHIAGDELAPWATCYRCQFLVYTDPERLLEVDARLQGAIDEFGRRDDPAGLAKAHRVRASARARLGRIGDCEVDLFEALIAARQSGDHRQITAALGAAPAAALWGPSPVPKAGGRCLDVVRMQRMTTAAPSLEATSLRCLAVLELLRGRPDKARTMLADARQVVADLGLRHGLMETELFAGIIESMEGDPVAAEPHFRMALEGLDALGVGADAGQAAALLAQSVLAQGRVDEADRHAAESERLAGRNLKTAIAWRAVRAEILAAQERHAEAVAMARDAVSVAAGTDLVLDHADTCLALSRVLAAAGDAKGAKTARDDADRLYAAKEVVTAIGRVVEPVVSPSPAPPTSSRLAVKNQSCEIVHVMTRATSARDVDGAVGCFSDRLVYDDRRRISGDPIVGRDAIRAAIKRVFEQYTHFEFRILAVRGQRLHLLRSRWSDDDGNETTTLYVNEIGDDGLLSYRGRFDEDDFEGAYRVLEERYYAEEGAQFAENGLPAGETALAIGRGDYDLLATELLAPDLHFDNRSRSPFPGNSTGELLERFRELDSLVASTRMWISATYWLSAPWSVFRLERESDGSDGELYAWTRVVAAELRDGRFVSLCEFDLDDEAAAFAYAEERMRTTTSRLAVTNRCGKTVDALARAMRAHDLDAFSEHVSDQYVYDDRRRISGIPVSGATEFQAAVEQILKQYNHFEWRVLAVRGDRLNLLWSRWSDDDGNETAYLHVYEIGDGGRVIYGGRFDEDDFESAYRELDRRYYAGEGAAYAEGGTASTEAITAVNRGDLDRLFGELTAAGIHVENRSRSAFPDRSASDLRASFGELNAMVATSRTWLSAVCWLSPTWGVTRLDREAVGQDGELYAWTRILVLEINDGRIASMCEFEIDDEASAFAYAEERTRAMSSRLAGTNRASQTAHALHRAMSAADLEATVGCFSDLFVYDDRRRLSGDPIRGLAELRAAAERILAQYRRFEVRTLAVRGEFLELDWARWSNEAGYETTYLSVREVSDDGRITYEGRFDERDFEGAYRMLEERYYAGEGAAFADTGAVVTDYLMAYNGGDFDRFLGYLSNSEMRFENRSRSVFPDRSDAEFRASIEELSEMVSSARTWYSAMCWLSPSCCVSRFEREAVGRDGERYSWTCIYVSEFRDGRPSLSCKFEIDDEASAFAYAEERMRATSSRLAVTNRSCEVAHAINRALRAGDADGVIGCCSDRLVYDDRRRLSGGPIHGRAEFRAAFERIVEQYRHFEWHVLAVRGDNLNLSWSRWSDDAGNETAYLHVFETGSEGRQVYEGRFDEDDFETAYRMLETRYYAGEGATFAESGAVMTEGVIALSQDDPDRLFGELVAPEFRVENRSRWGFGDRSAAEFRASFEELHALVTSVRTWQSAVCWLSPTVVIGRFEREALGHDGEQFAWSHIHVNEFRNGRLTWACLFETEDEEAAFAYAEERLRATVSRLAVANKASERWDALWRAGRAHDVDAMVECYAEPFVYDDRRRLGGNPPDDLRTAVERIFAQYSKFQGRTLAVRGGRLHLGWGRWSNDAGYETSYLFVHEVDETARCTYEGRFDEDDFDAAYRELARRYGAGEGAAFAQGAHIGAEWLIAVSRSDWDRVFGELTDPEIRVVSRSRRGFPDRSAAEFRSSFEELNTMLTSSRVWNSAERWLSPTCCVGRNERRAVGREGEKYEWTRLFVFEVADGRCTSMCEFEVDDEEEAFAYAEERVRRAEHR